MVPFRLGSYYFLGLLPHFNKHVRDPSKVSQYALLTAGAVHVSVVYGYPVLLTNDGRVREKTANV